MTAAAVAKRPIRSTIAARLDRLSWPPFHTRMVAGLAAARILDRLRVPRAGSSDRDEVRLGRRAHHGLR